MDQKFFNEPQISKAIRACTLCKNNKINIILTKNIKNQA